MHISETKPQTNRYKSVTTEAAKINDNLRETTKN